MSKIVEVGGHVQSGVESNLEGIVKRPWHLRIGQVFRVLGVDLVKRSYLLEGDWEVHEGSKGSSKDGVNFWINAYHFVPVYRKLDFTDIFNPRVEWVRNEQDS